MTKVAIAKGVDEIIRANKLIYVKLTISRSYLNTIQSVKRHLFPSVLATSQVYMTVKEDYISFCMARNRGHRNGARAGCLRNMAAKHSKEMHGRNKQNKIEQVLAHREQVPRSG